MNVYVVENGDWYEGGGLVGVYGELERAQAKAQEMVVEKNERHKSYDLMPSERPDYEFNNFYAEVPSEPDEDGSQILEEWSNRWEYIRVVSYPVQ